MQALNFPPQLSTCPIWQTLARTSLASLATTLRASLGAKGWTSAKVEKAIARYKMFLYLHYLYPNTVLVPTTEIDTVWHQHILLDTRQYIQDCYTWLGTLINHCSASRVPSDRPEQFLAAHFSTTVTLFELHFGKGSLGEEDLLPGPCADIPRQHAVASCLSIPCVNPMSINPAQDIPAYT